MELYYQKEIDDLITEIEYIIEYIIVILSYRYNLDIIFE
jgi:hypothetical protein